LLVLGLPAAAQGPELVKDIATGLPYWPGSYASLPVFFHGRGYFGADDGFLGYELWSTDGTQGGTRLIADLCPGRCSGNPQVFTVAGDLLYFVAGNTTGGFDSFWIWRSDGTAAGTFPLVDLNILGFGSALPVTFLAPFRGGLVFVVHERDRRAWGLWKTDGTLRGTRQIAPLPGRFDPTDAPNNYDWPRPSDDSRRYFFTWNDALWATDGTAAGTGPVPTPIVPCAAGGARLGSLVVYSGEVNGGDCEPWVSDGTPRGTHRLRDLAPGEEGFSFPGPFYAAGNRVYFSAFDRDEHRRLYKTDGTTRGTVAVRALGASPGLGNTEILAVVGSRVYFQADDRVHGIELWRTDGSPSSTALVADLTPGPGDSSFRPGGQSLGGRMFFAAGTREGSGLYGTRGTADSTVRLAPLGGGALYLSSAGGRVYFAGSLGEGRQELGVTDGTVAGTHVFDFGRPVRSSKPHRLIAAPGGLAFLADDGVSGVELWRSGGPREDTERLAELIPGDGEGIDLHSGSGGVFYFTFDSQHFGWTDGRTVRDVVPPGSLGWPAGFVDRPGTTLFFANRLAPEGNSQKWIWHSDGTPEGTAAVAPAAARGDNVGVAEIPGGNVRFVVQDIPSFFPEFISKLSETDGTAAGTHSLTRFALPKLGILREFVAAGRNVFGAFTTDSRTSLRASDGTSEGTREVYAIPFPFELSFLEQLTPVGDQIFFPGDDFEKGRELWASDGSPEGTRRVADLAPGPAPSSPSELAAFGDRLLFSADDREHGRELWISDGTTVGTQRLEIRPGPNGSYPQAIRIFGDRAFFAADDGVHGLELWTTDGTPEGTHLAADVLPGPKGSSPSEFEIYGGALYFRAGRPLEGYELWKLPLVR